MHAVEGDPHGSPVLVSHGSHRKLFEELIRRDSPGSVSGRNAGGLGGCLFATKDFASNPRDTFDFRNAPVA